MSHEPAPTASTTDSSPGSGVYQKVSQQTVIRCFDSGKLKGFRVPGSRFRRIPREALLTFMKDNQIPLDHLESGRGSTPEGAGDGDGPAAEGGEG